MEEVTIYRTLKTFLDKQARDNNLLGEKVSIHGKVLSAEEAIGKPQRQDFPLIKGKEKLLQAEFRGAFGQAFTDSPASFEGALRDFLEMPQETKILKAAYSAVINAVMR